MRLLILSLFICSLAYTQEYTEIELFDISGVTTDTIKPISYKPKDAGALMEVDFSEVNCDLLALNIGYGTNDIYPNFLDTIPGVQLPVILDKTVYTNTFKGVESNVFAFDISWYDNNYIWFGIVYNGACTSGKIKLRYSRK